MNGPMLVEGVSRSSWRRAVVRPGALGDERDDALRVDHRLLHRGLRLVEHLHVEPDRVPHLLELAEEPRRHQPRAGVALRVADHEVPVPGGVARPGGGRRASGGGWRASPRACRGATGGGGRATVLLERLGAALGLPFALGLEPLLEPDRALLVGARRLPVRRRAEVVADEEVEAALLLCRVLLSRADLPPEQRVELRHPLLEVGLLPVRCADTRGAPGRRAGRVSARLSSPSAGPGFEPRSGMLIQTPSTGCR